MYRAPLLIFLVLAAFSPWIDWHLSHFIYDHQGSFYQNAFLRFCFTYGTWPAWMGTYLCFIPFVFKKFKAYRLPAALFFLSSIIGCVLIVNGLLKEFWPRPRPVQVIGLGGTFPYRPFFEPLYDGFNHKSFPSGHAAAGFVFLALFWGGVAIKNRALKIAGLLLGLTLGLLLSIVRILMGGHFFFDTVTSFALMWFLPALLLKAFRWKN